MKPPVLLTYNLHGERAAKTRMAAMRFRVRDNYVVRVRVEGERELIFGDVVVRVNPNFRLAMHIDTDEGNAGNIRTGMLGYIEEIQSRA